MENFKDSWNPNHADGFLAAHWDKKRNEQPGPTQIQLQHIEAYIKPHIILDTWVCGSTLCYLIHPRKSHTTITYRFYPWGDIDEIIHQHA